VYSCFKSVWIAETVLPRAFSSFFSRAVIVGVVVSHITHFSISMVFTLGHRLALLEKAKASELLHTDRSAVDLI